MASLLVEDSHVNNALHALQTMGYEKPYIQRAISVHNKSKLGKNYDLSILVEIISRLKTKDIQRGNRVQQNLFTPHLSQVSASKLSVHDSVDFRFENGRWILCKIIEKQGNIALLHPLGHPSHMTKHDRYCDIHNEYYNFALPKSISLRKSKLHYQYKIDDYVDCNPMHKKNHRGWKHGRIIKIDTNSSQIKIFYQNHSEKKYYSYWCHVENTLEVSPYNTNYNSTSDDTVEDQKDTFDEHTQINDSMTDTAKREPKYSFLHNTIDSQQSTHSPKHVGITVLQSPYSCNSACGMPKLSDMTVIDQLHKFGYNDKDIASAMQNIPNPKDINEIITYIIDHNDDKYIHQQWDSNGNPQCSYDEQYCDTPNSPQNMMEDMFDRISEMDEEEKRDISDSETESHVLSLRNTSVFGAEPLTLDSTLIVDKDYGVPIPNVLIALKNQLFKCEGHLRENIFEIQCENETIQREMNGISAGNYENLSADMSVISNLICVWYQLLPQNIFVNIDRTAMSECRMMGMCGDLIESEMGEPNESYYKFLLDLCIEITAHEKVNKMSVKKLSNVIAKYLCVSEGKEGMIAKFVQLSVLWRHLQR